MFIYDLLTKHTPVGVPFPGTQNPRREPEDVIQQSGDAVLVAFPYTDNDTFSFTAQDGRSIVIKNGQSDDDESVRQRKTVTGEPIFLDSLLYSIKVRTDKTSPTGQLNALLADPENRILSSVCPGDWIFCWMFDNHDDAQKCRENIRQKKYSTLNAFDSGLKFMGKVFAARLNKTSLGDGKISRRISIMATSFSELVSHVYYDPLTVTQLHEFQFNANISGKLRTGMAQPSEINKLMATYLATFTGYNPSSAAFPTANRPILVPGIVGQILNTKANTYLNAIKAQVGIHTYKDEYNPKLKKSGIHPSISYTENKLIGYVAPTIQPFSNVPIWGILQSFLNEAANEIYTTLRTQPDGSIWPTVIIRQIPFNTDEFSSSQVAKNDKVKATAFRSLPRWRISDKLITSYDTGRSDALRVNYILIGPAPAELLGGLGFENAFRANVSARIDGIDRDRNGLRPYITTVNGHFQTTPNFAKDGRVWTSLIADRLIGSHLKLSGSMNTIGFQEPICVGDNLEYDGFVYHIESVEHSLTVNPMNGQKSFSTGLTLSNGVPITGPVLPEVASVTNEVWKTEKTKKGKTVKRAKLTGNQEKSTARHSDEPYNTFTPDKD